MIVALWILLSFIVAACASDTRLGFWGGFWLSLLLSPLIGFIGYLVSPNLSELKKESTTTYINTTAAPSLADELLKLKNLREGNHLSEEEYQAAKRKLIS